ncbi:MAG: large conductance mechanosensitive channel protein MscL [Propionicimonas sp.]
MAGFRKFLMRGNLIEVAVAFIIGATFASVTSTFTQLVMDVIGAIIGGQPNFDSVTIGQVNVGHFITAVVTFVLTAAVVYFGIVKPSELLRTRFATEQAAEPAAPTSEDLLAEIRDLLKEQSAQ